MADRVHVRLMGTAEELERLPSARPLWGNGHEEPALAAGWYELGAVLRPYFDQLPRAQRTLLVDALWRGRTQRQLATARGVTQQAIVQQLETARRALVAVIARNDPEFVEAEAARRSGSRGRPTRNYEGENDAAWRVLRKDLLAAG